MILLVLAALCVPPCAASRIALPGRVVFAGEGAVLDAARCAELAPHGRVVLDASGDGRAKDPMEAAGAPLARFAVGAGDESRDVADAVVGAPCVVLAGGEALEWYHRLFPHGHPSRLAAAIREANAGGATMVGAGASAPYLASFAMVPWSDLGKQRRNPRRSRDDVAVRGLALVEGFLLDSSARPRGDPAWALRAAFDGFLTSVLYLDGPAILVADPKSRSATIEGQGSALVFDLSTARRVRSAWSGGRLSRLVAGDSWSLRHGPMLAGNPTGTEVSLGALPAAFERAAAHLETSADERTRATGTAAFADLVFDLAWDRNGS